MTKLIEAETERNDPGYMDRRPFIYLPKRDTLVVGQPGTHHQDVLDHQGIPWDSHEPVGYGAINLNNGVHSHWAGERWPERAKIKLDHFIQENHPELWGGYVPEDFKDEPLSEQKFAYEDGDSAQHGDPIVAPSGAGVHRPTPLCVRCGMPVGHSKADTCERCLGVAGPFGRGTQTDSIQVGNDTAYLAAAPGAERYPLPNGALPWQPGVAGRAIVGPHGQFHAWTPDYDYIDEHPEEFDDLDLDEWHHGDMGEWLARKGHDWAHPSKMDRGQTDSCQSVYIDTDGHTTGTFNDDQQAALLGNGVEPREDMWNWNKFASGFGTAAPWSHIDDYPYEHGDLEHSYHTWQPGQVGKGFILPDGRPVTWNIENRPNAPAYAGPHHAEVAEHMGLPRYPDQSDKSLQEDMEAMRANGFDTDDDLDVIDPSWHSPIYIDEHGNYDAVDRLWNSSNWKIDPGDTFDKLGLKKNEQQSIFKFASETPKIIHDPDHPYQLGGYGKAAYVPHHDEVHIWATDFDEDGSPIHQDYLDSLNRLDDAPDGRWSQSAYYPYVINPQGEVTDLRRGEFPHGDHRQLIADEIDGSVNDKGNYWFAKTADDYAQFHRWQPGGPGKGMVVNNKPVTWNTRQPRNEDEAHPEDPEDPSYFGPHHEEMLYNLGVDPADGEWDTPVYINDKGEVYGMQHWDKPADDLTPFKNVGLTPVEEQETWKFASNQWLSPDHTDSYFTYENGEEIGPIPHPGPYTGKGSAKGYVIGDKLYLWPLNESEQPHHDDMIDHREEYPNALVYIDPDGTYEFVGTGLTDKKKIRAVLNAHGFTPGDARFAKFAMETPSVIKGLQKPWRTMPFIDLNGVRYHPAHHHSDLEDYDRPHFHAEVAEHHGLNNDDLYGASFGRYRDDGEAWYVATPRGDDMDNTGSRMDFEDEIWNDIYPERFATTAQVEKSKGEQDGQEQNRRTKGARDDQAFSTRGGQGYARRDDGRESGRIGGEDRPRDIVEHRSGDDEGWQLNGRALQDRDRTDKVGRPIGQKRQGNSSEKARERRENKRGAAALRPWQEGSWGKGWIAPDGSDEITWRTDADQEIIHHDDVKRPKGWYPITINPSGERKGIDDWWGDGEEGWKFASPHNPHQIRIEPRTHFTPQSLIPSPILSIIASPTSSAPSGAYVSELMSAVSSHNPALRQSEDHTGTAPLPNRSEREIGSYDWFMSEYDWFSNDGASIDDTHSQGNDMDGLADSIHTVKAAALASQGTDVKDTVRPLRNSLLLGLHDKLSTYREVKIGSLYHNSERDRGPATLYHIAPSKLRDRIIQEGLIPNQPDADLNNPAGVYLWSDPNASDAGGGPASMKTDDHDLWAVDASGLELHPDTWYDNPISFYHPNPIPSHRLRLSNRGPATSAESGGHVHNWQPGRWGKGLIRPSGQIHTWPIDGDSAPHHMDYVAENIMGRNHPDYAAATEGGGLRNIDPWMNAAFAIAPDGEVHWFWGTKNHPEAIDLPGLKDKPNAPVSDTQRFAENSWSFSAGAGDLEPWTEGRHGKGAILHNGDQHIWATDEESGWPGHATGCDKLGLSEDQVHHVVWVSPDGTLTHDEPDSNKWVFASAGKVYQLDTRGGDPTWQRRPVIGNEGNLWIGNPGSYHDDVMSAYYYKNPDGPEMNHDMPVNHGMYWTKDDEFAPGRIRWYGKNPNPANVEALENHVRSEGLNPHYEEDPSKFASNLHNWRPGRGGKGVLLDGVAASWNTDDMGKPHHEEMLNRLDPTEQKRCDGYFYISPSGEVDGDGAIPFKSSVREQFCAGHPDLIPKRGPRLFSNSEWNFSAAAEPGGPFNNKFANVQVHDSEYDPSWDIENPNGWQSLAMIYEPETDTTHIGAHDEVHHEDILDDISESRFYGPDHYKGALFRDPQGIKYHWYDQPEPDEEKTVAQHLQNHFGQPVTPTFGGNKFAAIDPPQIIKHETPSMNSGDDASAWWSGRIPLVYDEDNDAVHYGSPDSTHGDVMSSALIPAYDHDRRYIHGWIGWNPERHRGGEEDHENFGWYSHEPPPAHVQQAVLDHFGVGDWDLDKANDFSDWKFAKVAWTDREKEFDKWKGTIQGDRIPVVHWSDDNKTIIGQRGQFHDDLYGQEESYPYTGEYYPDERMFRWQGHIEAGGNEPPAHEEVMNKLKQQFGPNIRYEPTKKEDWFFAKTASKIEWLQERPDKFKDTPKGQDALNGLVTLTLSSDKIDPLTPWLWREAKKGRIKIGPQGDIVNLEEPFGSFGRPNISHWADWFASNSPTRRGVDLMGMRFNDFTKKIKDWDEELAAKNQEANMSNGKVLYQLPNGWTVRELAPEDLSYEGDNMGHCVGGYGYEDAVRNGDTRIISLRDEQNLPHATMELGESAYHSVVCGECRRPLGVDEHKCPRCGYYNEFTSSRDPWEIQQIQGKGNEQPKPEYQAMLKQWIQSLPENQKPAWKDSQEEISDLNEIIGDDQEQDPHGWGGYEPHGDYGIPLPPRGTDYDSVIGDLHTMNDNWRGYGHYDPSHGEALYEHALSRNEIPQLSNAYDKYQEEAHKEMMDAEDQNWEYLGYPGDYEDDPQRWEEVAKEEGLGQTGKEAFDDAYERYLEAHSELSEQVPIYQASRHMGDLLSRHWDPETGKYENPTPKPSTFA